jgi:hypothetical protein
MEENVRRLGGERFETRRWSRMPAGTALAMKRNRDGGQIGWVWVVRDG